MAHAMIEGLLTREEGGVWFVPGEVDAGKSSVRDALRQRLTRRRP